MSESQPWHSTDAQPASGHAISCTPSGPGTASNPWHAPDAHPAAGHGESAAMGRTAEPGASAEPAAIATAKAASNMREARSFFGIVNLSFRERLSKL